MSNDNGNRRSPFFFFVGSGISWPSVPLSASVRQECEQRARSIGRADGPKTRDIADVYSHWFRAAFPHRLLRQQYLRSLIEDAPITHANLRLADLLLQGTISNLVVTPNFDDLLSRALTLFGRQHVICDDPRTVERIDPEKPEIQLIHVHGSYWFYDCRNTDDEIRDRAMHEVDTTLTMAALLDKILAYRSPLVIGYGGWDTDVFMTALRRRLLTPLPFNLYWFCYQRADLDQLPDFLNHPDVYFVVPHEQNEVAAESPTNDSSASTISLGTSRADPLLTATTVLDSLIRQMGVETPLLTKDPLAFFAEQLRRALPRKEDAEKGRDIYSFRSVLERVERAKQREIEEAQTVERNEGQLECVREAVRRAQYDEAYDAARQIDIKELTKEQLMDLMKTMDSAARAMTDSAAHKPESCGLVVDCYDRLAQKYSEQPFKALVSASMEKGNYHYGLNLYDAAVAGYDLALSRLGDTVDTDVQNRLAAVRNNKGLALKLLNRFNDALTLHDAVVATCGNSEDDVYLNSAIVACLFKAVVLHALLRKSEAHDAFEQSKVLIAKTKELNAYTKLTLESHKDLQDLLATEFRQALTSSGVGSKPPSESVPG